MKFAAAVVCLLLSVASLFDAVSGAGFYRASTSVWPSALGFVIFGLVSAALFVSAARRGL